MTNIDKLPRRESQLFDVNYRSNRSWSPFIGKIHTGSSGTRRPFQAAAQPSPRFMLNQLHRLLLVRGWASFFSSSVSLRSALSWRVSGASFLANSYELLLRPPCMCGFSFRSPATFVVPRKTQLNVVVVVPSGLVAGFARRKKRTASPEFCQWLNSSGQKRQVDLLRVHSIVRFPWWAATSTRKEWTSTESNQLTTSNNNNNNRNRNTPIKSTIKQASSNFNPTKSYNDIGISMPSFVNHY